MNEYINLTMNRTNTHRWGGFKNIVPNAHALCEGPVRQQVLWPFAKGHVRRSSPLKGDCDARKGRERSVAIGRGSLLQRGELRPNGIRL